MSYSIVYRASFRKEFAALPGEVRRRVAERIDALGDDPCGPTTDAMRGNLRGLRKVRIGDYRVVYEVDDEAWLVRIVTIGHRRDVYKRLERQQ